MKSSENFSCWRIDFSITRTPCRIRISRSIRRSSFDLDSPICTAYFPAKARRREEKQINRFLRAFATSRLNAFIRLPLSNGLIRLLERLGILYRSSVHVVPDVHQLLAGAA